jgi:glycosyltransferase involved in cell wall biosynthesis
VDAFIALTRFQRDLMVAAGLPGDRVSVKPQFYTDPPQPLSWEKRSQRVVSIGRLSEEKGVRVLLAAWLQWGRQCPELDIIGDGPLRQELQALSDRSGLGDRIHFLGQLPFAKAQERLSQARLMVVPSLCFEGFPMVIREAFALGVPVAASNLGSLPCIVHEGETGVLIEPGNAPAFYHTVKNLWDDQKSLSKMGQNARMEFEEKYTADVNHKILMEIYEKATLNRRKHSTGPFS